MDNKTTAMIFNEADLSKVSHDDMQKVNDLMSEFIESSNMPEKAKKMKMHIALLLSDKVPYAAAKMAVDHFVNEDGSKGEHWTYEQTKAAKESKGYDFDCVEWYYALNKVYSDYYSSDFADEVYFKMASQYLNDKDGMPDKVRHMVMKKIV